MKVLHYIPSIDQTSGGVGSYLKLLASSLGKLVELHVVSHHSPNELYIPNCKIHYIDNGLMNIFKTKRQYQELLKKYSQTSYMLIHAGNRYALLLFLG